MELELESESESELELLLKSALEYSERISTHCAWNCVTLRCLSRPNDDDNLKCKLTLALCDPTLFDPTSHTVAFFNRFLRPIFATPPQIGRQMSQSWAVGWAGL